MASLYTYLGIFGWVLAEQAGLPLPAAPVLLAAGALIAAGRLNPIATLAVVVLAALVGDFIWYYLGRRYGTGVMGRLCKLSLEPDSCVRRTENFFARYGPRSLLVVKFIPGLSSAATPIAGSTGVPWWRFLLYDGLGATIWAGTLLVLGRVFQGQVERVVRYGESASVVFVFVAALTGIAAYGWVKYRRRSALIKRLRVARITPEELKRKLDANEAITILDLRHPLDFLPEPYTIPGAVRVPMEELEDRTAEIPKGNEVVVYCTCPNEATSAMTSLKLRHYGIGDIRPLAGGFHAWRERGFPLESEFGPVEPVGSSRADRLKTLMRATGR